VEIQHLVHLWLVAFVEPSTASGAAHSLARWIRHADADPELRPYLIELLENIVTTQSTGRRIEFYLTKTSALRNGLPEWARTERRPER
jgi:hypothetical protein